VSTASLNIIGAVLFWHVTLRCTACRQSESCGWMPSCLFLSFEKGYQQLINHIS